MYIFAPQNDRRKSIEKIVSQSMKNWKGLFRKCIKGSFENSKEVRVPIKRDNFPYFNIYELLRKGYAAEISLLLEILSVITTGDRLILQITRLSDSGNWH